MQTLCVGWLGDKLRSAGFDHHTWSVGSTFDLSCMWMLSREFNRLGVDVIHSHEFASAVYGAGASRLSRIPQVITMHGGRYYASRQRRRLAMKVVARHCRGLTAVSRATAEDLEQTLRLQAGTVTIVPNGTRLELGDRALGRERVGIAEDELLVLAVGNLYPVKGHRVLLEALARLPSVVPPWRLAIAGRGGEERPLMQYASRQGLGERVMLLGVRDDIPDLLAAADVFVMPSLSEGMPVALVEAMMAAKAIVASEVGGIPETVTDNVDALLVPAGDADALAGKLARLLTDAKLRSRIGLKAARTAREDYTCDVMARRYVQLYQGAPAVLQPTSHYSGLAGD